MLRYRRYIGNCTTPLLRSMALLPSEKCQAVSLVPSTALFHPNSKLSTFTSTPILRWNFKKMSWQKFQTLMNELENACPTPTKENINTAYNVCISAIRSATKQSIPRAFRIFCILKWDD